MNARSLGRPALGMLNFRKERNCTTSYELAGSISGEINGKAALRIASHLKSCDFCTAELEFYRHYSPDEGEIPAPPIPSPLLELAEALIAKETIHISRLEELLRDAA